MMPHTFGQWKTVYGYFNTWSREGHWQQILEVVTRSERVRQGRKPQPSAGSVDDPDRQGATYEPAGGAKCVAIACRLNLSDIGGVDSWSAFRFRVLG